MVTRKQVEAAIDSVLGAEVNTSLVRARVSLPRRLEIAALQVYTYPEVLRSLDGPTILRKALRQLERREYITD